MAKVLFWLIFLPLSPLIALSLYVRNLFFDLGILPSRSFRVPLLVVGNIEAGGSGKTPLCQYLIRNLHQRYKLAFLSRGYKRSTRGYLEANEQVHAAELGDEPFLTYSRWKGKMDVLVCEDRAKGIDHYLKRHQKPDLFLLDDAMQHRWVKPDFLIVVSPFKKPFFKNHLFPFGRLRDFPSQAARAQAVVFTGAPQADEAALQEIRHSLPAYLSDKEIFVSSLVYSEATNAEGKSLASKSKVVAIAGIAHNEAFFSYADQVFDVEQRIPKPDHYAYPADFFDLPELQESPIVCTEKDFYKLLAISPKPERLFCIRVEMAIYPEQKLITAIEQALFT